jgi:hypothetical protein
MGRLKLEELMKCFKIGIYQLFFKKNARLEQIKGFKKTSLLFTIGGRIVDSAHPLFGEVVVYLREQQEAFL